MKAFSGGMCGTRIEWIDLAKGVGIFLVVFGHLPNGSGESVWLPALDGMVDIIYAFHMPLFFLLAGMTFSMRGGFRAFAARKVRTLLVPYCLFSLYWLAKPLVVALAPSIAAAFRASSVEPLGSAVFDVLVMGGGPWFLLALFWAELMAFGLVSLLPGGGRSTAALGAVLTVLAALATRSGLSAVLPFKAVSALEATGFILMGVSLRPVLLKMGRGASALCAAASAAAFCLLWVTARCIVDLAAVSVVSVALSLAGSFAVVFACIAVGRFLPLQAVGRDSLVYYVLNAPVVNVVKLVLFGLLVRGASGFPFPMQLLLGSVAVLATLVLLTVCDAVIRRWLPWAIGVDASAPATALPAARRLGRRDC